MTEKIIEHKATEMFIARYGLTIEEFAESESYLKNTIGYAQCFAIVRFLEMSEVIANLLQNAWDGLKGIVLKIANIQEDIEKKKALRSSWTVKRDTRVRSQVLDNKPRNLVRKIIR